MSLVRRKPVTPNSILSEYFSLCFQDDWSAIDTNPAPWHYAAELNGIVFEIYQGKSKSNVSSGLRFGFEVGDLDNTLDELRRQGARIVQDKARSPWGMQAVVKDFAGYCVHLTTGEKSLAPIGDGTTATQKSLASV